jgi:hypothetical protein
MVKTLEKTTFQARVQNWIDLVFSKNVNKALFKSPQERRNRFAEEAVELVQACGMSKQEVIQIVEYVYSRPMGELDQEAGGTMVALAGLCNALDVNMEDSAETELQRIHHFDVESKIRAKFLSKPSNSPLQGQG